MCIHPIFFIGIVQEMSEAASGLKMQHITFFVYFVLGLILGFLLRHLFGILNVRKKLREKKLRSELETLDKRAARLEEENRKLKAELMNRDKEPRPGI